MTWAQTAKELIEAADRARMEGDMVAFIVLTTKAAECNQIARLLNDDRALKGEGE